jgi:hypothetical protein
MLINPGSKTLKCGKWLLQAENDQLDGTSPSRRHLCHQSEAAKFLISKICLLQSEQFKHFNYLKQSINESINHVDRQMRTIGLQIVHKCVVPLGLDSFGLHRKDSRWLYACTAYSENRHLKLAQNWSELRYT